MTNPKFKIGQRVKYTRAIKGGIGLDVSFECGREYIVAGIHKNPCTCRIDTGYLIEVGFLRNNPINNVCDKCAGKLTSNSLMDHEGYFDVAEEPLSAKYSAEIVLIRELANGKIDPEAYRKINKMLNGDEEMFNLAEQIIIRLKL